MTNDALLPAQFAALEPFVADWGELETVSQRYVRRQELSMERLTEFWAALGPRLEEVFNYLEQFPMHDLPPAEARLYRLTLGLTEAAQAVEFMGQPRMTGAPFPHLVEVYSTAISPVNRG